jgi:hypothetical protein
MLIAGCPIFAQSHSTKGPVVGGAHAELAQQRSSLNPALELQRQAKSLIDALLIGDLWLCAQGQQRSAYPWILMDRKPASHLGHVVRIVERL